MEMLDYGQRCSCVLCQPVTICLALESALGRAHNPGTHCQSDTQVTSVHLPHFPQSLVHFSASPNERMNSWVGCSTTDQNGDRT